MNDLISVIIPIYNVEKYLKKCIDSVLMQSYENLQITLLTDHQKFVMNMLNLITVF